MSSEIQVIIDEQNLAKVNAEQLISAFGAPFTQAGEILAVYGEIKVTDESQTDLMAEAKSKRLTLKKIRTTVENKRKELKEDSLRTGKAIDGVARYIREHIQPAEDYLELQEKFIENKEAAARLQLIVERTDKISKLTDNPRVYSLDTMTDDEFDKLLKELTDAYELRLAQEQAYADQQEKIRLDKEVEDARIREENEILKKQAEVREAEIEKEREQQRIIQEAEIKAAHTEVKSTLAVSIKNSINAFDRYTVPGVNGGHQMVDYESVINLIESKL